MGLFLGEWLGKKSEYDGCWLRWWDRAGNLLLWGGELVAQERQLVAQERQLAAQERQRAEQAEEKSLRLAERLKEMGIDPADI